MPEKTYGRKPGDRCGSCSNGRLVARFQGHHSSGQRIGGPPGPPPSLHHLVCSGCGILYESAVHGSLDSLIRDQLKEFANPDSQPAHCPQCTEEASEFTLSDGFSTRRYSGDEDAHAQKVLCCHACVLLLWKFPTSIELLMDNVLAEAATPLTSAEAACVVLMSLWQLLDAGGVSDDRSRRAAILEGITRGKLLPKFTLVDCLARFAAAEATAPDPTYFSACSYTKRPSRLRDREFLALLLAWLRDWYRQEMEKDELRQPVEEHRYITKALQLLPLDATVPVWSYDVLIRERDRRRLKSSKHQLLPFEKAKTPR